MADDLPPLQAQPPNRANNVVEFGRHKSDDFTPPSDGRMEGNVQATEQLKRARVLVVTGLLGSTEFIEAYATASGIKCESVPRGSSAITLLTQGYIRGRTYDMVFVERLLPDMDAFEFAREIKQEPILENTKLVLVSTFDSAARDDAALQAGFVEHIAKPVKQQQVLTTITAVLTGQTSEEVEAKQEQSAQEAIPPAVARGQRMVLIAEDNPVNQKVALLQLRELGFFATVVTNGREAVDVYRSGDFDAILMDCQMPEMDGFEATRHIREWEFVNKKKRVPIIAMTASDTSTDRDRALEAGMDAYLAKPVTYDTLDSILYEWVESDEKKQTSPGEKKMQEPISATHAFGVTQDPVDVKGLAELLGMEEAIEVLHLFVQSTDELVSHIFDATTTHDAKALKEAAHQLKGAASSVGSNNIARACLELEQCAREDDWAGAQKLNEGLAESFKVAKAYIETVHI